ncbi:MAG: hypothetical protein FJ191_13420 [Gammaproteobacteria bacterium]|nr:hypothetical protein [Gammaproteobacteria bacterium]
MATRARPGKKRNRRIRPGPAPGKALAGGRAAARELDHERSITLRRRQRAIATATRAAARPAVRLAARRVAALGPAGIATLVAEGDSWFDYLGRDVIAELEERGYDIESVAHHGDRVEAMAYAEAQLLALRRALEKLARRGEVPRAILLSGGGNDLAGDGFAMLLDHARAPRPGLNENVLRGVIDTRIRDAYLRLIAGVTESCRLVFGRPLPILLHGYAHAVPDGRGVLGGFWFLPGPWLAPGFRQKGFLDLEANRATVAALIDRFNAMLQQIPRLDGCGHVHCLDLRAVLPGGSGHRRWWANELHPTRRGFRAVAEVFIRCLESLEPEGGT